MDEQPISAIRNDPPFEMEPSSGWLRLAASAFILFHLFCITVWNMPHSYFQMHAKNFIGKYVRYVVLDQGWGMFSVPGRENYYMQARITYANGEKAYKPIGRQDTLNPWARLLNERERKMIENVYMPMTGQPFYNQMALWALRSVPPKPDTRPVRVELTRHWSQIPPLPDGLRMNPVTGWNSDVVYSLGLGGGKPNGKRP